jgi:glucose-1-phosphate cytidylyltransferase
MKYTNDPNNTKVLILAGGLGTRFAEETNKLPKPMIKIGGLPILLHIINIYKKYNLKNFIILGGYKVKYIKNYFKKKKIKNLNIEVLDTGIYSNTAGRLYKLKKILRNETFFLMTYGDGVANINIKKLINFHIKHKPQITMTAVKPLARFGIAKIKKLVVEDFYEKPKGDNNWVNGGFFVVDPIVLKLIKNSKSIWEKDIMPKIVKRKKLFAFKHTDFWYSMDTLRDKRFLTNLIKKSKAKWL